MSVPQLLCERVAVKSGPLGLRARAKVDPAHWHRLKGGALDGLVVDLHTPDGAMVRGYLDKAYRTKTKGDFKVLVSIESADDIGEAKYLPADSIVMRPRPLPSFEESFAPPPADPPRSCAADYRMDIRAEIESIPGGYKDDDYPEQDEWEAYNAFIIGLAVLIGSVLAVAFLAG